MGPPYTLLQRLLDPWCRKQKNEEQTRKIFKKVCALQGHKNWVLCLAWSPDGKYVISGSMDGQVLVWQADTGTLKGVCRVSGSCLFCHAAARCAARRLCSYDRQPVLRGCNMTPVRNSATIEASAACVFALARPLVTMGTPPAAMLQTGKAVLPALPRSVVHGRAAL